MVGWMDVWMVDWATKSKVMGYRWFKMLKIVLRCAQESALDNRWNYLTETIFSFSLLNNSEFEKSITSISSENKQPLKNSLILHILTSVFIF